MTSATATALPLGEDTYALSFELHNSAAEPVHLASYEPFLDFEIIAGTEEAPVPVHQPELDIGVREVRILVPGGGTALVQTPVRLRVQDGAEPGSDGFVWTVPRHRDAVSIQVRLLLPPPFDLTCPLAFAP